METLDALKSRLVVSAICCNERSASPETLPIVRRISALAVCRSCAIRSWLLRLAVSDLDLDLLAADLPDFGAAGLERPDLVRAGFARAVFGAVLAAADLALRMGLVRFRAILRFDFRPRAAIFSIPAKSLANPGAGVQAAARPRKPRCGGDNGSFDHLLGAGARLRDIPDRRRPA